MKTRLETITAAVLLVVLAVVCADGAEPDNDWADIAGRVTEGQMGRGRLLAPPLLTEEQLVVRNRLLYPPMPSSAAAPLTEEQVINRNMVRLQAAVVTAKSVTLAWDAPQDSTVAGYRIYYWQVMGSNIFQYAGMIEVGAITAATITALTPKTTYGFHAVSFNSANVESVPSNEVSYTPPGSRVRLITETTADLAAGLWSTILTNFVDTDAALGFYRLIIKFEE